MTQITKVYLLNVPMENDYKNTLYFPNKSEQEAYFQSRILKSFTDFSYQRKDSIIRVPAHIEAIRNVNYVMYLNTQYTSKWMYAFVTDMKYVNDERTDVYIETDCIQTYLFNYNVRASFVEREHVDDDTPGLHTVPEGLETGPYYVNTKIDKQSLQYKGFLVGSTIDLETDGFPNVAGGLYNGVYSGVKYFYYATPEAINEKLVAVAEAGKSDAITSIFCVPTTLVSTTGNVVDNSSTVTSQSWEYAILNGSSDTTPVKPTTLNGYTPKNNKLLTHPYQYLLVTNNSGGSAVYRYERFTTENTFTFQLYSALTPGMSVRLVPKHYDNLEYNHNEGINLGKFPICNWNTDVYTNWLTQNAVNIGLSVGGNLLTMGTGVAMLATSTATAGLGTLAGAGTFASGALGVADAISQVYQHSLTPPQSEGNVNSGDVTFSSGNLTFSLYYMSIKAEYARIIDEYFSMYGYKVNRVKVPNRDHRSRYWYIKTIDVNIDGTIPNKDMQVIKNCYDRGITFWRNVSEMGNYSLDNAIV